MDILPSPAAQNALLGKLRTRLEPILVRESLSANFVLQPGPRLRRAYGRCTYRPAPAIPSIAIRCTADGDRTRWRREGAIMGTLLHEVAHLRYRSHGPRFWALHRRLVDRAVAAGVYDPTDRDPAERGRGDEKLAASAAWPIAMAARARRLERRREQTAALSVSSARSGVR
ncbi:MAG: M48 family metallopeptidase [Chloroflexi bacterium]|nr:M48 family metallopeptidase [Chloroflexota bacterium]